MTAAKARQLEAVDEIDEDTTLTVEFEGVTYTVDAEQFDIEDIAVDPLVSVKKMLGDDEWAKFQRTQKDATPLARSKATLRLVKAVMGPVGKLLPSA